MSAAVVIFDVYRTLIDISVDEDQPETYEFLSNWLSYQGIGIRPDELHHSYKDIVEAELASSDELYPDVDVGDVFLRIVTASTGYANNRALQQLVEELCKLFRILTTKSIRILPEVSHILETLHKKDRLAIASNSQRLFTLPELKKFGIERYFTCLVFSSDVRACKPSPKVFTEVCRIMKVHPQHAIFVGDNLFDDIWGAKRIGMKTVWVNRGGISGLPAGHERPAPDRELTRRSYCDLPDLISTIEDCTL